ncbi:hypothetical protein AGMMS49940_22210 [Spirochaetia bacterium]|nr:hypothetical protein AGMMS49940_22210 [Spirochaetia bacterium]
MPGKIAKNSITILAPLFALFLTVSAPVFGKGKAEEAEMDPLNPRWVLCISALDVSSLPPAQRVVGDIMVRRLVKSLTGVDHRVRVSEEEMYYKNLAFFLSLEEAGKKLAAKRTERDLLLYKGYPSRKYQTELKTANEAVKKLEEEYHKAEEAVMKISAEPAFQLTEENTGGTFPAPPAAGGEYRYCVNKKADAFVSGEISEFHGRLVLTIRMYTLYTRSFEYEDSFMFSTDDMNLVQEELAGHLTAAISGSSPSALSITADPDSAVILVKENFAGQGDTGIREYSPGPVDVVVSAEGHETASASVDLAAGELTELRFNLRPIPETSFAINFPDGRTSVYQDSLYIGEAPVTITAPLNQFQYIHGETPAGASTAAIFRAGQTGNIVNLPAAVPKGKDPRPLGTARRGFYISWAVFWITLPTAFILTGVANTYKYAYEYTKNVNPDPDVKRTAEILNNVSIGAWVGFGLSAGYSLFRILWYNHTASKSVPKMAKNGK